MVVMRVDQLEDHAIAIFGAFQHPAEQHLVDPVDPLPPLPVGDRALAVVDREDEIGSRPRSEEHTSELQSLMRISYAVFCLKKKKQTKKQNQYTTTIHKQ